MRPRLETIYASLRADLQCVADIGYDRGTLLSAMLARRPALRVIGVERQPGARNRFLSEQPKLIEQCGDRLELRQGDGFGPIGSTEIDGAVVAGIGSDNTVAMLSRDATKVRSLRQLIVCTPDFNAVVRPALHALGMHCEDERLVLDRGRFYEVIAAAPGPEPSGDELARLFGPRLIERPDPLLIPWLEDVRRRYRAALDAGLRSYRASAPKRALAGKLGQIDRLLQRLRRQ